MHMRYEAIGKGGSVDQVFDDLPEDKKKTKAKSCCSWTVIRRLFRILVLIVIVAAVFLIVLIYFPSLHKKKTVSGTTANPFKVILENCKLYIKEDSGIGTSAVEFDIDVPGSSYSFSTGSTTELTVKSSLSIMDPCVVDMKMNPQAQLPGLQISCTGTCKIVQAGPNPLNLGTGTFTLSGNTVDFMATQMALGLATITVEKGNLAIFNLAIDSSATTPSSMSTGEGDIVVQSVNSMKISWTQDLNNICFNELFI